jgi:hypothetical protein
MPEWAMGNSWFGDPGGSWIFLNDGWMGCLDFVFGRGCVSAVVKGT